MPKHPTPESLSIYECDALEENPSTIPCRWCGKTDKIEKKYIYDEGMKQEFYCGHCNMHFSVDVTYPNGQSAYEEEQRLKRLKERDEKDAREWEAIRAADSLEGIKSLMLSIHPWSSLYPSDEDWENYKKKKIALAERLSPDMLTDLALFQQFLNDLQYDSRYFAIEVFKDKPGIWEHVDVEAMAQRLGYHFKYPSYAFFYEHVVTQPKYFPVSLKTLQSGLFRIEKDDIEEVIFAMNKMWDHYLSCTNNRFIKNDEVDDAVSMKAYLEIFDYHASKAPDFFGYGSEFRREWKEGKWQKRIEFYRTLLEQTES